MQALEWWADLPCEASSDFPELTLSCWLNDHHVQAVLRQNIGVGA